MKTIHKRRVRSRDAETKAARLEGELAALKASFQHRETPQEPPPSPVQPPPAPTVDPNEPQEANYATYESFIEARSDYRARKAVAEEFTRLRQQDAAQQQQATLRTRIQAFAAEHPDYVEVISNPELILSPVMGDYFENREEGPAIAYQLAKDPARFKQIASMHPRDAIEELGLIRAEIRRGSVKSTEPSKPATPPKPVTSAPPP